MDSPTGAVIVPCTDLDQAMDAYRAVGFQLQALGPADDPRWAEMTMPGLRLVLTTERPLDDGVRVRIAGSPAAENGPGNEAGNETEVPDPIDLVAAEPTMRIPEAEPELVVGHETADGWVRGRAGMLYRDLIPNRHGGAFIASHIHVPTGGPVPDYVHHHDVGFQMIFCHRGWVRVVYQDQGPAFVLEPGDLVLQPPGIRHRVLESSDDLYVVEITCPADHRTNLDHRLQLPSPGLEPNRSFGGQRFVRHIAADARWQTDPPSPLRRQVTGIAAATGGLASAEIIRVREDGSPGLELDHDRDLRFLFLLEGRASLHRDGEPIEWLRPGSSVAIPPAPGFALDDLTAGTSLLDVTCRAIPTGP